MSKKIKILIDHEIFSFQRYGGISRAFVELYKNFSKDPNLECELPILFSDNEYIQDVKKVNRIFPDNKTFLKQIVIYLINRIYTTFKLLKGNYDILQPTYYDPYFLPFLKKKPFVLVIHDMTHEIFSGSASKKDNTVNWKRKLVSKADKIIAVSENTKKDIIKFYNVPKEKIEIVSWGTDLTIPKKDLNLDLPERYILYVGNRTKYKNFNFFFKSVTDLLKKDEDLYLVCAGGGDFSSEELKMVEEAKVSNKIKFIKFQDSEKLSYIYNHALAFIFPSLYEGFGIPILEAFACECPAIVSNKSSLPEVGGDSVEYFDPKDENSIRDAVEKVVNDEGLRESLILKGKERLKMFSWKKAAEKFIEVYNDIL